MRLKEKEIERKIPGLAGRLLNSTGEEAVEVALLVLVEILIELLRLSDDGKGISRGV